MVKKLGCLMAAFLAFSGSSHAKLAYFSGAGISGAIGFTPALTNGSQSRTNRDLNIGLAHLLSKFSQNSTTSSTAGFFGRFSLDYLYQFDENVVLGIGLNLGLGGSSFTRKTNVQATVAINHASKNRAFFNTSQFHSRFFISEELKLGYAMNRWFPFAVIGLAQHKIRAKTLTTSNFPILSQRRGGFCPAFVVGGGLQYALTDRVSALIDYAYHRLTLTRKTFGAHSSFLLHGHAGAHYVSFGLTYRFLAPRSKPAQ